MFDESVSYYRLFPYRISSLPPPLLFLAPGTPPVDPLPPQGPAPSGVSQVDPAEPVEVAVHPGTARGAEPAGAGTGDAETGGTMPEGAGTGDAEPGVSVSEGAEPWGAETERVEPGGCPGVPSRREPLSPQRLREWYARRCRCAVGATGIGGAVGAAGGGAGAAGVVGAVGAAGGAAGAVAAGAAKSPAGAGAAGPRGTHTGGTGAAGTGGAAGVGAAGTGAVSPEGASGAGAAGGPGAGGAAGVVAEDPGAVSAISGGAAQPRPYYVPLLQQVLGLPPPTGPSPPLLSPPPVPLRSQLKLTSPLPVRASRRVSRQCPPPVPGTHSITLRPSTASQRDPLPSPPTSSLFYGPDPESDSLRAASPNVMRFLATSVTDPLLESSAASALVAELVEFAATCRLDYTTSLVAYTDVLEDRQEEFECFAAAVTHLVSMVLAPEGDPDAPDIPTPRSYAEAIEGPYSSQWQVAMDAEMASWKSTGTYVDEVPPPGANIV
ncbi:unnamed protein product [Closterium sp. NIES-54]